MPSSSLFLGLCTTLISITSLLPSVLAAPQAHVARQASSAAYSLTKEYSGSSFFDQFYFFPYADPTHGYVTYGDRSYADSNNLIKYDGTYNYMYVDSSTKLTKSTGYYNNNNIGRKSVRIEGTYDFTHALIITDVAHMPAGICGTWPAFWTLGRSQWPTDGEIDIIEGANNQGGNWQSLHTGADSSISRPGSMAGSITSTDCAVHLEQANPNYTGCKITDPDSATFGSYKGGVWATEWTSSGIKVWYWPYGSVPSDVTSGTPKPSSSWGTPRAWFGPSSSLNADKAFKNHHIIFDTTFCGDLGDATWGTTSQAGTCAYKTGYSSCSEYVAKNPSVFADAYWKVKYVKIFQNDGTTTTSSTTSSSKTTSSSSSSKTSSSSSSLTTTSSSKSSSSSSSATPTSTSSSSKSSSSSSLTTSSSSSKSSSTSSSVTTSSSSSKTSSSSSVTTSSSSTTTSSSSKSSSSSSATTSSSSKSSSSSSATTSSSSKSSSTSSATTSSSSKTSSSSSVTTSSSSKSSSTSSATTSSSSKSSSSSSKSSSSSSATTSSSSKTSSSSSSSSKTTSSVTSSSSSKSSSSSSTTSKITTTSSASTTKSTTKSSTTTSRTTRSRRRPSSQTPAASQQFNINVQISSGRALKERATTEYFISFKDSVGIASKSGDYFWIDDDYLRIDTKFVDVKEQDGSHVLILTETAPVSDVSWSLDSSTGVVTNNVYPGMCIGSSEVVYIFSDASPAPGKGSCRAASFEKGQIKGSKPTSTTTGHGTESTSTSSRYRGPTPTTSALPEWGPAPTANKGHAQGSKESEHYPNRGHPKGPKDDDKDWFTKTVTDTFTIPCDEKPGYTTTIIVHVTKVPVHPDPASTWLAWSGKGPSDKDGKHDDGKPRTVTDVFTIPCSTAPGYTTTKVVYMTKGPAHPEAATEWNTYKPAKPTDTWADAPARPDAAATWATYDKPVDPAATWAPVKVDGDKPADAASTWAAYPVVSVTVAPQPPAASTWASASVPVADASSAWVSAAVPVADTTAKAPAASATAWNDNPVKVWKGAASSTIVNINAIVAIVAAGIFMML